MSMRSDAPGRDASTSDSEAPPRLVEAPADGAAERSLVSQADAREIAPPHPEAFQLAMYQASMRTLFARVREIDIATFESAPRELLRENLKPRTSHVLAEANHLLGELLDDCEPAEPTSERPSAAIDRAIARVANSPTCLDFDFDLSLSLRVRKAYGQFRTCILDLDVSAYGATSPEHVRARLLATGREIAVLVGLPIYPFLRLADRTQLRGLQQRLIGLLRTSTLDLVESLHLWSDIVSFASMLSQVNRRQELFEHDSRIVIRVVESLTRLGALDGRSADELRLLEGRDEDVDTLLRGGCRDLAAWAPVLTRLAQELGNSRSTEDDL